MVKIILMLFVICLVSLVKTGLWETQGHICNNHISHCEYKHVQVLNTKIIVYFVHFYSYKAREVIIYFIKFILTIGQYIQTCLTKVCIIIIHRGTQ